MTTDPHKNDFDGCNRECRKAGAHTLSYGRCEHADKPEPTVSMSKVYTDTDGYPSIGYDQYTVTQLADLIEPAINEPEPGWANPYDAAYGRWRAEKAAHAIVNRNDEPTPAAVSVPPPATRADAEAVARVREKATEWAALAPADDWGDTPQDTTLADAGRYLLRLIDGPCVAGEQQAPLCRCGHGKADHDAKYSDPQCRLCPEDGERSWRHAYTPAGEQQNETPEAETPTTTKPETTADRDTLRRQFGDVLRRWGLLDEQIDQKAAEEYAVTDLLALLPEQTSRDAEIEHLRDRLASCRERVGIAADKAIAAEDAIARARQARRRLTSALIAVEPLLTEPYPDDPRWTPWTRFVGPALKELSDALKTGPAANDEPPAAGVRQDGAAS